MATKTYLIKLTPIDPYYFGTDVTFGEDGKHYYVRGRKLPQQTTLLGWLRYELLVQNGKLGDGTNPEEIDLVGLRGFDRFTKSFQNYGRIKNISPVFIADNTNFYIPQAKDWANVMESGKRIGIKPLITTISNKVHSSFMHKYRRGGVTQYIGDQLFKDKDGLCSLWLKNDGIGLLLDEYTHDLSDRFFGAHNGFFTTRMQTGNKKNADDETREKDGYFRQEYYHLLAGFSFAFLAELDLAPEVKLLDRITQMGGEQSSFKMEIEEFNSQGNPEKDLKAQFGRLFPASLFHNMHPRYKNALVLTSDAYVDRKILDHCDFAMVSPVPFNSLNISPHTDRNYAALSTSEKGKQVELLERGSIFFADDLSPLMGELNQESWQQIGYNYYLQLLKNN